MNWKGRDRKSSWPGIFLECLRKTTLNSDRLVGVPAETRYENPLTSNHWGYRLRQMVQSGNLSLVVCNTARSSVIPMLLNILPLVIKLLIH